jgi:taurine dioxygenase
MTETVETLRIVPTGAALGAEVRGVDLAQRLDDETFRRIDGALSEHGMLFFRGQDLTVDEQVAFARRFGDAAPNVNQQACLPGYPEVLVVSNVKENGRYIGVSDAGITWHTDQSSYPRPPRCSVLYAKEVPVADDGTVLGDTIFSSAAAAYDALPADIKARLEGKRASHSYMGRLLARKAAVGLTREIPADHADKMPAVWHPVFRAHPVTGRKSIYVTEGECTAIEGMPDDEALELIAQLHRLAIEPRFHYRHRWQRGDVIMWDNCTCQHLAVRDYREDQRRLMYRVSVDGAVPV